MEANRSSLQERFQAIETLQKIRAHCRPGSPLYERADYAVDLALSPQRGYNGFFIKNLLRDAKKILVTKSARSPEPLASVIESGLIDADGEDGNNPRNGCYHADPNYIQMFSAEDEIVAREFLQQLCQALPGDRYTRESLFGLLAGETAEETGERIGISGRHVKNFRWRIRQVAHDIRDKERAS